MSLTLSIILGNSCPSRLTCTFCQHKYQVPTITHQVPGTRYQVPGTKYQVPRCNQDWQFCWQHQLYHKHSTKQVSVRCCVRAALRCIALRCAALRALLLRCFSFHVPLHVFLFHVFLFTFPFTFFFSYSTLSQTLHQKSERPRCAALRALLLRCFSFPLYCAYVLTRFSFSRFPFHVPFHVFLFIFTVQYILYVFV